MAEFNLGTAFGLFPAGQRSFDRVSNALSPKNNYPDASVLANYVNMSYMTKKDFATVAGLQGYSEPIQLMMLKSTESRLSASDYIIGFHRGYVSEEMLDKKLRELKFVDYEIDLIKKISLFFPSASDLTRFAVREVYTPNIVEKYNLMQDIPDVYLEEAKKAGLPLQQARNLWASHWELPSMSMGFEMFHRQTNNPDPKISDEIKTPSGKTTHNVIGKETLKELIKTLDVSPFWRDKLIEISYQPLTRVDVRRMYGLGVLDQDGVFKNYLDAGYTPENAKLMTDFTIKYESNEYDGITRASLVSSYADGVITLEELTTYLKGLGYTEQNVNLWVSQAQYDKTMSTIKLISDDIVERYQMGAITLDQVRVELLALDVPAIYVDAVITKVIKVKAKRTKVPTLDDLKAWLSNSLIDETYFTNKMRLLGYKDEDIQIYLTEVAQKSDTSIVKYLSETVYVRWLKQGIMTSQEFVDTLIKKGLTEDDINKLIKELEVQLAGNQ